LQYKEQQEVVRTPYKIDEKKLRTAINNEDIFLVYQPKVRVENAKFVGAEVLARWQHAEYGVIPPLIFIELAEKHGLISDLTYYILNKTFQQLAKWQQHNLLVPVSVNISEADLQYIDLPEHIMTLSHRYDIDPSLITLEITESCLIGDVPQRLEVISRLRLRNIGLSIDDFGTGYSSLEKLRNIPFTELKIDKSFIQYVNSSKDDYNIVKANIELAKVLGLQTVAEGVEEKEQIAILKELGCDIIQGYYYSKPLPADEFEVWLRKHLAIKN